MTRLELDLGSIGRVTIEGDDPREIIEAATFWASLPPACPVCGATVRLQHQRVKSTRTETKGQTFDYYRVRCTGSPTAHEVTLGEHKDKQLGLFFPEDRPWEIARAAREPAAEAPLEEAPDPDPRQAAAAPQRPAQAARRPAAQPAPATAQPQPAGEPASGLNLRAELTTRFGIRGPLHRLLAEHALKRPVEDGDWPNLSASDVQRIKALADDVQRGRVQVADLRPA